MRRLARSGLALVLLLAVCLPAECAVRAFSGKRIAGEEKTVPLSGQRFQLDMEYLDYYGLEAFDTALPVVYIDTGGQQIEKENKVWAEVGILNADRDAGERSVLEEPDELEAATIKMRGASSYYVFEKKQYRLKFYKKQGGNGARDVGFLGMADHSEWVLNGPYLDKTLLRNRLIYGLAGEIFAWAPDTRYFELFLNGRYQGVYLAVEPVTTGAGRLNLSEYGLLSGETAYIVKRDRIGTEGEPLNTYGTENGNTRNRLYLDYPSEKRVTEAQRAWIEQDISRFERSLYGGVGGRPSAEYEQYIDLDNFVDYFIFNEVCMNYDAGNLSTYVYKDLKGKMKLAVWDYNNAYDNYQWFSLDMEEWMVPNNSWFEQLVKDRRFVDRVQERYWELRRGPLDEAHIYERIARYQEELGGAIERNYGVWGCAFDDSFTNEPQREIHSYQEALTQLKQAIHSRFAFLDRHLADLYQRCEDGGQTESAGEVPA